MRTILLSILITLVAYSTAYSLEPVLCAISYTGGGAVTVEVQLYDYGTSTNIYPGVGSQNIGSLTANSSGIISFVVGSSDTAWAAITASSVTNNYMVNVYIGGAIAAYLRLDELVVEHGTNGAFSTLSNVTSNISGNLASDDFVFGSSQLDDDSNYVHYSRLFFDKSKGAFRAGSVDGDQWDDANVGEYSFATGRDNTASGEYSTVSGRENTASGDYSSVGGGYLNIASGESGTVSGGVENVASGIYSIASGGQENIASGTLSTASGGFVNTASGEYSTVGGGYQNGASNNSSTVGGGYVNTASGEGSVVCGGVGHAASGYTSTVGGGYVNTASGYASTVGGGSGNTVSGNYSTVGGGADNTTSGLYSIVCGGYENTANGQYNLVFGHNVNPTVTEDYRVYFFDGNYSGMLALNREDADHPIHVGTDGTNGNGAYLSAGGTWVSTSSITKKDRFENLSDDFILTSIMGLPIEGWFYKLTEERHIGPFAEDFHRVFGTGELNNPKVDKSLSSMDVAGVSLRAVQALMNKIEALEKENHRLMEKNIDLETKMDKKIEALKKDIEKLHI
jgi:hypothetical protein